MNNRWLCSSSNIVPWPYRNTNLSTRLTRMYNKTPSLCVRKKCFEQIPYVREPMLSVQEQRQARKIIPIGIKCKSNYTDKCYAEYNINSFRRGFGQLKDIRYESMEPGKPSLVINSSTLDKNENDIVIDTNRVLEELAKIDLRKRFSIVHTEEYIYVIGGYIYDPRIAARKKPSHDYKYDMSTDQLISIQALPNGAIGFGLCVDDDFIYAVGGNDPDNIPLSDCYGLSLGSSNEKWIKLPNLPAPTTGPGVGVHNGELHCIGGYDILGNESLTHGEYLTLRYPQEKQWRYRPELEVTRARPLVLIIPDDSITGQSVYVAGGFDMNRNSHKPYIVPDVQLFNQTKQCWQRLTIIPKLSLLHALSFNDNKLHVSETIELPNRTPISKILRSFDLQTLIWSDGKDDFDKKKIDEENSTLITSSSASSNLLPDTDIKTNQNSKVAKSSSPSKTKVSTLKIPNFKSQQNKTKSGTDKTHEMDHQSLIVPKKTSIKMKDNNTSKPNSTNPSSLSLKKQISISKKVEMKRLKMKTS